MQSLILPQLFANPLAHAQIVPVKKISTAPYIPPEIIRIILGLLRNDKKTLTSCALVNHTFNLYATPILYHTVAFTFPYTFTLFANATNDIKKRCSKIVRHLDLSGFSTCGLRKSSSSIQKVITPDLLIHILRSFPSLKAFSISDTLESVITFNVLKVLFLECKNINTIDFCGCSSKQFGITLEELSLHECPVISECSTIIPLLAHAPNLTHLDLGGCSVGDLTLTFLGVGTNAPTTLSHLLLAKCKNISSSAIASFVFKCSRLETLNLFGERDIATAIAECDLMTILHSPNAKNFQTLDIGSSQITPMILTAIKENCSSLQNLGISKARISNISLIKDLLTTMTYLQYIDLTSIPCFNPLNTNNLFTTVSKNNLPIHTIEMSESLLKKLCAIDGWNINFNYGRRWYYARETHGFSKPEMAHSRKLDITESGPGRMSKIFQYYSFGV
ncbi:1405_t:CDS:2 [Gigaspora margarita]|uniref:1405_t:CDS:1 n=1 Tax=Gigaspora margarita TaxID=4874 RepID=A0ABN7VDX2_GIGMA|nr:1405_t:CDS:2 [Gigaspora margarita]